MNISPKYRILVSPANITGSKISAMKSVMELTGMSMEQVRAIFKLRSFVLCEPGCEAFKELIFTSAEASLFMDKLSPNIHVEMIPVGRQMFPYGATVGTPNWEQLFASHANSALNVHT